MSNRGELQKTATATEYSRSFGACSILIIIHAAQHQDLKSLIGHGHVKLMAHISGPGVIREQGWSSDENASSI